MFPKRFRVRQNHGNELPSNVLSVAVLEQNHVAKDENGNCVNWKSAARIATIAQRRKTDRWTSPTTSEHHTADSFWNSVCLRSRTREPLWLFVHSAHLQMQLLQFWSEFDRGRFCLQLPARVRTDENGKEHMVRPWRGFFAVDDGPFVVYCICPIGTIKVVDVKNYYDCGLDELRESFGIPAPVGISREWWRGDNADGLAFRAEVIQTAMIRTMDAWKRGGRGNWQPTAARLSDSNYRHEFGKDHNIIIDNENMNRPFQRSGCFGGESQHWFKGDYSGKVFKVDVIGLYASVMRTGDFPREVIASRKTVGGECLKLPDCGRHMMARVEIWGLGDLPMRREDKSVAYPTGIFWTTLCGEELEYAVKHGRLRQVVEWQQYDCKPIFARFVAYWWSIRKQAKITGDKATDLLAKMIMNSQYGNWSKRSAVWNNCHTTAAPMQWGHYLAMRNDGQGLEKLRCVAGVVQRQGEKTEKNDTFPAISAFIAAAGRVKMRNIRKRLPVNSVLAQQTDSLLVTEEGMEALKSCGLLRDNELGGLRIVDQLYDVQILDANHYTSGGKVCMAGLKDGAERIGPNRWAYEKTTNTAWVIASGPDTAVRVTAGSYLAVGGRSEREYGADGWAWK